MQGTRRATRIIASAVGAMVAIGVLVPTAAIAQTAQADWASGNWQYRASLNGWLPTIGGKTSFPAGSGGSGITVTADQIISALKFAFMGSFDANNGRYGAFTDLLYVDLGGSKSGTRNFSFGNVGIPADTTADLKLDIKATVWTLAGEVRVSTDPASTVDILAGARMLDAKEKLDWTIMGSLGPISPTGRSGNQDASTNVWDAIIGVKGRFAFGQRREWMLPYYFDVGAGQSQSTWQAAAGIGYSFGWGDVIASWRYLDYKLKSGKSIESLNLNGPMLTATFRW